MAPARRLMAGHGDGLGARGLGVIGVSSILATGNAELGPVQAGIEAAFGDELVMASDLDDATRKQLDRGQRVTELMKQRQYSPLSVGEMAVSLFAADRGYLDDVEMPKIVSFEAAVIAYMASSKAELLAKLNEGGWNDDLESQLVAALDEFKATGTW